MLRKQVEPHFPFDRLKAAGIAAIASHFNCTATLEKDDMLLHMKSIIGLLSQTGSNTDVMDIVVDGEDEEEAMEALSEAFEELTME